LWKSARVKGRASASGFFADFGFPFGFIFPFNEAGAGSAFPRLAEVYHGSAERMRAY